MSDEEPGLSPSEGDGTDAPETGGHTAVVTRPLRPTGKRSRRTAVVVGDEVSDDGADDSDSQSVKGTTKKSAKATKDKDTPGRNPIAFVWNYLKQVVAELRKVIWPNRKQMVSYTTVVLTFLVFMVALIGGVDLGLAKLVMLVFG